MPAFNLHGAESIAPDGANDFSYPVSTELLPLWGKEMNELLIDLGVDEHCKH
jgi:hypothetical protein